MAARRINIFTAASPYANVYAVFCKMVGESLGCIFIGLYEWNARNGIVFDHVYKMSGYLPVNGDEIFSIFNAVVLVFEKNVFKRDIVLRFLVEVIQRFYQKFNTVLFIDRHDLVAFCIVGSMKRKRKVEPYLVVAQLTDHFCNACS